MKIFKTTNGGIVFDDGLKTYSYQNLRLRAKENSRFAGYISILDDEDKLIENHLFSDIEKGGGGFCSSVDDAIEYLADTFTVASGGGGGGGDASAANQLVEIGHLANFVANQTNGSQISQINDGAGDALNINTDGSINVVFPSATNLSGDLQTTSNFSLLNCSFINQKNDLLFTELTAGGSTISVTGNGLNFSCANLQACYIKSRARLHYMKGVPLTAEFTVSKMYFQTAGPGFKMVGFYSYEATPDNLKNFAGIFTKNTGATEVLFRVIRNGSEVFSQDVTAFADWLNGGVICRVTYLWLGYAGAVLQIRNVNTGEWDTVSVFNYPTNIAPFFSESDLFFGAGMDNNSGAAEEFNLLCVNVFRAGQENLIGNPLPLSNNSTVTCNRTALFCRY